MNTVADKLMKLVQTKSDIRQALLDKGFNVPDTMPFSGYADLIRRFPCNAKDFPDIPGMIARWSAKGLTNEDMSTNPVWKDLTGNGHDLQMKNFAWGGMSGVGGYVQNFNYFRNNTTVDKVRIDEQSSNSIKVTILTTGIGNAIFIAKNIYQFNKSYFIKISSEGYNEGDLSLSFYAPSTSTATTVKVPLNPNGITEIPAIKEDDFLAVYLNVRGKVGSITIEQLPLYPGALVFDGVDDYGICENFPILTKEKGYTVVALRQWISYNPNAISAIATNASDQSFNGAFTFENYNKGAEQTISYGSTQISLSYTKSPLSWQTTSKYNGVNIANGSKEATNSLVLARSYSQRNEYANFAIWELAILDHDATEEELQKIQNYYKQEYPWLFPDQAWTVTGKTNEDADRATIANITGNGNNLVLSNFGFAENSGYGLYGTNYTTWTNPGRATYTVSSDKIHITKVSSVPQSDFIYVNGLTKLIQKIKVTGLPQGVKLRIGRTELWTHEIATDGIYNIKVTDSSESPLIGYNIDTLLESCDITIEQIPEYQGYLVTDGKDDAIHSSNFSMSDHWTVVGEWKMLKNLDTYELAGFTKNWSFILYNYMYDDKINVYIHNGRGTSIKTDSIKALTSTGLVYINDFNVKEVTTDDKQDLGSSLLIGYNNNVFTKLAFKNLAIYSEVLSKEDCIKAYNYLQTLKS